MGFSLSIKIAQRPYTVGSLGPKALKYESFDAKGLVWLRAIFFRLHSPCCRKPNRLRVRGSGFRGLEFRASGFKYLGFMVEGLGRLSLGLGL